MTTLNPSHNIFRTPDGRHAQAVHVPEASSGEPSKPSSGTSSFPDDLPISDLDSELDIDEGLDGLDRHEKSIEKARREGRKRVRQGMVPVPDLRFEQSYLLSIRPFLTPRPTRRAIAEKGPAPSENEKGESKSLVESTEEDAVLHWGRQVDVQWGMVTWVTIRDQIISPLIQGALWGWGGLLLTSAAASVRGALYPASHIGKGRMTGGAGGKVEEAGGGSAVGNASGWWRNFVKSWTGAVETATV